MGSQATIRVVGEIDLVTASVLQEALERARLLVLAASGCPELLVDLRGVSFLGAAGLRVLAVVQHRCVGDGMRMRVVSDQTAVRRPMKLAGLEQLLATQ